MRIHPGFALLSTLAMISSSAHADGATFRVANNGIDTSICGGSTRPCRSISQAMENAAPGDTILVGMGRYGDINGNGSLYDPGDEKGGVDMGCMVCVTKPLKLVSESGAVGTVIDAGGLPALSTAVEIRSNNVTFGRWGHGFTVTNAVEGLAVAGPANKISIVDNIAIKNRQSGFLFRFNEAGNITQLSVTDNIASGNGEGFTSNGAVGSGLVGAVLQRNSAVGNLLGLNLVGKNLKVLDNLIDASQQGVFLQGVEITFSGNTVTNSDMGGVYFLGSDTDPNAINLRQFSFNSLIGNRGPGISLYQGIVAVGLRNNNIFGNGTSEAPSTGEPPNCGILNASRRALVATNNFWGTATGVGPDPADLACNLFGSTTSTGSPRSSPVNISAYH
ncbi:MAG: hypothetical protein ABW106_07515 [Steroidobacteraceae bacterium]